MAILVGPAKAGHAVPSPPHVVSGFSRTLSTAAATQALQVLRWAGDPEGGAPFVEANPARPDQLVGFDVEIADLLAAGLRRTPEFLNIRFDSIDQSVARGDADIGLSGIEDTPARRATMAVTLPYYEFREVDRKSTRLNSSHLGIS